MVPAAAWYGYGYGYHRYYGYHHRYHHRYYAYYPRYHHRYYAHRSWWGRLLTPNFEAASTGGFLFCGGGVATLDYIVLAVLIAGLVVAVVITVRSNK